MGAQSDEELDEVEGVFGDELLGLPESELLLDELELELSLLLEELVSDEDDVLVSDELLLDEEPEELFDEFERASFL